MITIQTIVPTSTNLALNISRSNRNTGETSRFTGCAFITRGFIRAQSSLNITLITELA